MLNDTSQHRMCYYRKYYGVRLWQMEYLHLMLGCQNITITSEVAHEYREPMSK